MLQTVCRECVLCRNHTVVMHSHCHSRVFRMPHTMQHKSAHNAAEFHVRTAICVYKSSSSTEGTGSCSFSARNELPRVIARVGKKPKRQTQSIPSIEFHHQTVIRIQLTASRVRTCRQPSSTKADGRIHPLMQLATRIVRSVH